MEVGFSAEVDKVSLLGAFRSVVFEEMVLDGFTAIDSEVTEADVAILVERTVAGFGEG